jgi:hypothetical protein
MTRRITALLFSFIITFVFAGFQRGYCQLAEIFEEGPIHESFVTKVSGNIILEASISQPPHPIQEKKPRQIDMQSTWIPGYWAWNDKANDFVWVSGVWRRPPPSHQWISGFWKQYDQGWVWIPGFWSRSAEQSVDYVKLSPPNELDENTAPPPSNNYFWVPGYWVYQFDSEQYKWVRGNWEELDPNWIFVPSHYMWRPGGYVFVPAFWDWPLENRGTAYSSVVIKPELREKISYEPLNILKPTTIVKNLYPYYPDYLSFFQYHRHYHPDFWQNSCCPPPWWGWDTWWSFAWQDQWSLWWWFTHPGYPQPTWITPELSGILPPPLEELVIMLEIVNKPGIITPMGVTSPMNMLEAIHKVTGFFYPILPTDNKALLKLYRKVKLATTDPDKILRPIGRRLPLNPTAIRPNVRKPVARQEISLNNYKIEEDLKPRIPFKPKIPSNGRTTAWSNQSRSGDLPVYTPPVHRPSWTPRPQQKTPNDQSITSQNSQKNGNETDAGTRKWRRMKPYETQMKRPPVHAPSREHQSSGSRNQLSDKYSFPQITREGQKFNKG